MRIHFICRGNGLRSTMAEAYVRSLQLPNVTIVSSGSIATEYVKKGMPVSPHALGELARHHIEQYAKPERTQLTPERVQPEDVVVCLNQRVYDECLSIVDLPADTRVWDVADMGEGVRVIKTEADPPRFAHDMFAEITRNVDALLRELQLVA